MIEVEVHIPCCQVCFDWMRPTLMVEYPFHGVIWVCLNGCAVLAHGRGEEPDNSGALFFAALARRLAGVS